jgi:CubicO group peptidase (beta-lactamase class C family)
VISSAEIRELIADGGPPGLAIGVCNRDEILWSAGFGRTDAAGGRKVDTRTIFSGQSCSKMFTATATVIAARQGLVDLDEPITAYLPEFTVHSVYEAAPQKKMTLRHLLSHTAGFTHEAPIGSNFQIGRESFAAHCRSISDTWLRFPVGHHYEYSNLGIDLAGYILQRMSGTPFAEFVRETVFQPLRMRRSTFDHSVISADRNRARGHDKNLGGRLPVRVPMVAAGALYTSVDDACRYLQAHLRGEFPEMYAADTGYGLGIATVQRDGALVRGHSGGGFGFLCDMYFAPDHNFGVVVLTNAVDQDVSSRLTERIFRDKIGPGRKPRIRRPKSIKSGSEFAGEYVGRGTACLRIVGDGTIVHDKRSVPLAFTADREFVAGTERFRLDPPYLIRCSDGFTFYRNDVPAVRSPEPPDGPWNREYTLRAAGVPIGTVRLLRENGVHLLERPSGSHLLRLEPQVKGLFRSSTGETLDLRRDPPTYANIRLWPCQ